MFSTRLPPLKALSALVAESRGHNNSLITTREENVNEIVVITKFESRPYEALFRIMHQNLACRGKPVFIILEDGSFCEMAGLTQEAYKHGVPAYLVKGDEKMRINMTFRCVIPGFRYEGLNAKDKPAKNKPAKDKPAKA